MDTDPSHDTRDYLAHNRDDWNARSAEYQRAHADQLPTDGAMWGVWSLPEHQLGLLGEVDGKDVVELGCGGAQFSLSLARRGARCTGVDLSEEQLAYAARMIDAVEAELGARPSVELVHANAEATGLPAAAFDIAFCDHGASVFADPLRWIPEAARLVRPGGLLAFSLGTPMLECCWPIGAERAGTQLVRPYFGMHRIDDAQTLFMLPYGEWIRLLVRSGFDVVDLVETRPPAGVEETTYRGPEEVAWSRQWPAEMIWVARRRAS